MYSALRCCVLLAAASLTSAVTPKYKISHQLATSTATNIGQPLDGFVSYSIEFASFPDFAGNTSQPNKFSYNLLKNIGELSGTKPYIRVGGNTQDYAIFDKSQKVGLVGIVNASRSADYPTTISIGPSYFQSFETWPGVKYSFGFNLGGNNYPQSVVADTLNHTAALACKLFMKGRFYTLEYGNEADLFATSAQGPVRPSNYNESDYVVEWLAGTRTIRAVLQKTCPCMFSNSTYGYMAPSFAGTTNHLRAPLAWADGLDADQDIKLYSSHNYISGATSPGVTLQGTLMNHTNTVSSVSKHVAEYNSIDPGVSHIFGETNSLYNQGRPGLSNSFGAALWGIDFNLYSATVNIRRVHMHMGTNYRYASWQPVETNITSIGTKPPYYGNIAVAAFLGDLTQSQVLVTGVNLGDDNEAAAYAAYVNSTLRRVMIVNLHEYNYTLNGTGEGINPTPRVFREFAFDVGALPVGTNASVHRLLANGSDAITGITWDGLSYNYELAEGRPVRLSNVTVGETVTVANDSVLTVGVWDSGAVLLDFGS